MSKKKTDEELLAELDDLGKPDTKLPSTKPTSKSRDKDADTLERELGLPERTKPSSRPHTPRLGSTSTTSATRSPPKRAGTGTPPSNDGARSSEEKSRIRKSGESSRSFHNSLTPASTDANSPSQKTFDPEPVVEAAPAKSSGGGGWWGALSATASAAVKQAEALAKEIQQNEEAQRWATQVRGNVGALRGFGGELRSRALPTFTNILHTLAPPISSHERLQIHITHDLVGYPSLEPLIYATFSRVMAQVEGGDLMVIQRGQESRKGIEGGFTGSSNSGWSDGPWWRQASTQSRSLGAVKGVVEGTKLAKASADGYATEYFSSRGGLEEAAKQATEILNESNPVRSSDIFLAIQAISHSSASSPDLRQKDDESVGKEAVGSDPLEPVDESAVTFAIHLHDPIHGISFSTLSQSFPEKWTSWLDASSAPSSLPADSASPTNAGDQGQQQKRQSMESQLPEDIADIVESGGVDPREWVAEWVEEALTLAVGILAQRYVAKRMGVGQSGRPGAGGLERSVRSRVEASLESGGGEAARVI